ncbi:MAG: hypothetical protein ACYTGP_03635 [Planctomycetota bacterium]|jgi:hypothetical protein
MTSVPPNPVPASYAPAPEATPPAWPIVIGIIGIVFGALGAFGGCLSAGMTAFAGTLADMMPPGQEATFAALEQYGPVLIGMYLGALVLAVLLLVGGIGLVRRRPWSIPTCIAWAILKMAFVIFAAFVNYLNSRAQLEATQQQFESDPNMPSINFPDWLVESASMIAGVFGLLWGWALPVFMLIWFARRNVKEHIRSWGETYV